MCRITTVFGAVIALFVFTFCVETSEMKGVPVEDSVAAGLRGGACTGYTTINNCDPPFTSCASECYKSGGGNTDQNASSLADVCKVANGIGCDKHFQSIAPCGGGGS